MPTPAPSTHASGPRAESDAPASRDSGAKQRREPKGVRRVIGVTPCFNNPRDLVALYEDLPRLELDLPATGERIDFTLIVVDNASNPPMAEVKPPIGVRVEILRLDENTGGSGGYNAGMAAALQGGSRGIKPEFVWLIDSDARPDSETLRGLIETLDDHPEYGVMGSALAHPDTGEIFELGGTVDWILCQFGPAYGPDNPAPGRTVKTRYTAACSALARAEVIEKVGLFPDVFLNADDVEWCVRITRETGQYVGATLNSIVRHPQMKPGPTIARYFQARNCFGPVDAMRYGPRGRFIRTLRETPRAMAQCMIGRKDLAELVMLGLRDAACNKTRGRGALAELKFDPFVPFAELPGAARPVMGEVWGEVWGENTGESGSRSPSCWIHPKVVLSDEQARSLEASLEALGVRGASVKRGLYPLEKESFFTGLFAAAWRWVRGPRFDLAVIPVRGRPNAWARGRVEIHATPDRCIVRPLARRRRTLDAVVIAGRGIALSVRMMMRRPAKSLRERLPDALTHPIPMPAPHPAQAIPVEPVVQTQPIDPGRLRQPSTGAA